MEQLTEKQAMKLVEYLRGNDKFCDNGSSRAVFRVDGYAVKIACEEQGLLQNSIEKELYKRGDYVCLNPIRFYYDDLILVCDWVDVLDRELVDTAASESFEDFKDFIADYWTDEYDDWTEDDLYQLQSDIKDVVEVLTDEQGDSSDNTQLGFNREYQGYGSFHIVAYDYGYNTDYELRQIAGDMEEFNPWDSNSRFFQRLDNYFWNGDSSCWGDWDDWEDEEEEEDDE